jgi:hypothetical protein
VVQISSYYGPDQFYFFGFFNWGTYDTEDEGNRYAKRKLKLPSFKAWRDKKNLRRKVPTLIAWKRFRN